MFNLTANNKRLLAFLLGATSAAALSLLAFQNPTQPPPGGGGMLYTSGQNVVTQNHLFVSGKLRVGDSTRRMGIELYDIHDGSAHCLQVATDALVLTNGNCP